MDYQATHYDEHELTHRLRQHVEEHGKPCNPEKIAVKRYRSNTLAIFDGVMVTGIPSVDIDNKWDRFATVAVRYINSLNDLARN